MAARAASGAGDGGDLVHHIGVVVVGDQAEADVGDAVGPQQAAGQGLAFVGLHRDDPYIVGPGLDAFAPPGDGAAAATPMNTASTRLLPSRAMASATAGPVTRRWYSGLSSQASQSV